MREVLTSIQPPHTDNIFDNLKGIEWRTKPLPTGRHYCYETKNGGGLGKVIGEFTIWKVKRYEKASYIPETDIDLGCVPKEFLMAYSKGKPIYANYIAKPIKYDKPRELSEFYVEGDCDCMNCKTCAWFDRGNGYNVEDDCNLAYKGASLHKSLKPITRPPQSWCYVESEDTE